MESLSILNDISYRYWKINPRFHIEVQQTSYSQGNTEQKPMLVISQYLNSNYATMLHQ
jgi:hypothetical protein